MKLFILHTVLFLLLPFIAAAQKTARQKIILENLARDRSSALIENDTVRMKEILDDRFFYTNSEGVKSTREEYITNMFTQHTIKWLNQKIDSLDIQLHRNITAILSFKVLDHFVYDGKEYQVWNRSTFVYMKKKKTWKCISGHTSEIGEKL